MTTGYVVFDLFMLVFLLIFVGVFSYWFGAISTFNKAISDDDRRRIEEKESMRITQCISQLYSKKEAQFLTQTFENCRTFDGLDFTVITAKGRDNGEYLKKCVEKRCSKVLSGFTIEAANE